MIALIVSVSVHQLQEFSLLLPRNTAPTIWPQHFGTNLECIQVQWSGVVTAGASFSGAPNRCCTSSLLITPGPRGLRHSAFGSDMGNYGKPCSNEESLCSLHILTQHLLLFKRILGLAAKPEEGNLSKSKTTEKWSCNSRHWMEVGIKTAHLSNPSDLCSGDLRSCDAFLSYINEMHSACLITSIRKFVPI